MSTVPHSLAPQSSTLGRLIQRGSKLLSRVGMVGLILGTASLAHFSLNFLVGNLLAEDRNAVGRWGIFFSLIASGAAIGMCGTASGWACFYSRADSESVNWWAHFRRRLRWILPVTILCWGSASLFYGFPLWMAALLWVAIVSFQCKEILSVGLIRARHHFGMGAWHQKLWVYLSLLGLTACWLSGVTVSLQLVASIVTVALVITALSTFRWSFRHIPQGTQTATREPDRLALTFWPVTLSLILSRYIDRLILGGYGLWDQAGSYHMIVSVMGGYELAVAASGFVLLPYFNRQKTVKLKLPALLFGLSVALIATAYLLLGAPLVHHLFRGHYDDGIPLIPIFVLAGSVRFLGVLPGSLIGARLGSDSLRLFSAANISLMPITAILSLILIPRWGMVGAAWSLMISETIRTAAGFGILYRYRHVLSQERSEDRDGPPSSSS